MDAGAALRRAREERGLTLHDLARVTRITLPILNAIERSDIRAIPPRPYGRAFVRTYAREVGLNPEQIVHEFFARFAPPPSPPPDEVAASIPKVVVPTGGVQRPRLAFMLPLALAAALMVFIGVWAVQRTRIPEAVGTAGDRTPRVASAVGRTSAAAAAASRDTSGVTVSLEATGPSWVTAHVDGRRILFRTLQPGEREVLRADKAIRIRTGDAGALRWQIDGGAPAAMGYPGEVRTEFVTASSGRSPRTPLPQAASTPPAAAGRAGPTHRQ